MATYSNILLSCTFAIGDVVMATSAAALLRKIYPDAKLTIIVKKLAEEMAINNPVFDDVISADYKQKHADTNDMRQLLRYIKNNKYDLFVSLDGKIRPALMASLAKIPVRVGPSALFGSNTYFPLLFTRIIAVGDFKSTHYTEVLQQMIRAITGSNLSASPVLPPITPENRQKASKLFKALPSGKIIIGLCAKTNHRKMWPSERFAELIEKIYREYDASFYVIGGSYDREYIDNLISHCKVPIPIANFCGETSLLDFMAMLTQTNLFISLDSAPMHIASAMDISMIAIFGGTLPVCYAPLSQKAIILVPPPMSCIPCIPQRVTVFPGIARRTGLKECSEHKCMQMISVDTVFDAVKTQLEQAKA
jgi:lipopolysaccharide heptosyltransferase II